MGGIRADVRGHKQKCSNTQGAAFELTGLKRFTSGAFVLLCLHSLLPFQRATGVAHRVLMHHAIHNMRPHISLV